MDRNRQSSTNLHHKRDISQSPDRVKLRDSASSAMDLYATKSIPARRKFDTRLIGVLGDTGAHAISVSIGLLLIERGCCFLEVE
jgi:hypothetical protein